VGHEPRRQPAEHRARGRSGFLGGVAHPLPKTFQAPLEEAANGGRGAAEAFADLGHGQPVPVLENQGLPLGLRETGECRGQADGLLVLVGFLRGRRARRRNPEADLCRGLAEGGIDRHLPVDIPSGPGSGPKGVGQVVRQYPTEPRSPFSVALRAAIRPAAVRFEEGLLDQVRGLNAGAVAQLEASEQVQIGPEPCQVRSGVLGRAHIGGIQ